VDPSWNCQAVRNTVDLLVVLDRMADKMEIVSQEVGEKSSNDLFTQIPTMMRVFRIWVGAKIAPHETQEPVSSYGGTGIMSDTMMMDSNLMPMPMIDFGNNLWLDEIFGRH
jgi:hypothetical protein